MVYIWLCRTLYPEELWTCSPVCAPDSTPSPQLPQLSESYAALRAQDLVPNFPHFPCEGSEGLIPRGKLSSWSKHRTKPRERSHPVPRSGRSPSLWWWGRSWIGWAGPWAACSPPAAASSSRLSPPLYCTAWSLLASGLPPVVQILAERSFWKYKYYEDKSHDLRIW